MYFCHLTSKESGVMNDFYKLKHREQKWYDHSRTRLDLRTPIHRPFYFKVHCPIPTKILFVLGILQGQRSTDRAGLPRRKVWSWFSFVPGGKLWRFFSHFLYDFIALWVCFSLKCVTMFLKCINAIYCLLRVLLTLVEPNNCLKLYICLNLKYQILDHL